MAEMGNVICEQSPGHVSSNQEIVTEQRNCPITSRRVLSLSMPFPSDVAPTDGMPIKERMRAIADLPGYEVRVIAPVPYFPPIKRFKRWYHWSQFPREEVVDGLDVTRPRYFLPPQIGGYFHPVLMYPTVRRAAKRLRRKFDFDLIDAHFAYPNGVLAVMLGRRFQKPVVITGRGEDMCCFPKLPIIGRQIRWAIKRASHCIGVSREIADLFVANGADPQHVSVVPNGVDTELFSPIPQQTARETLNLPKDARIILSVGDRLELKGFHILINALPRIRQQHPHAMVIIVGGPGRFGRDYTSIISTASLIDTS